MSNRPDTDAPAEPPMDDDTRKKVGEMMTREDVCEVCKADCYGEGALSFGLYACAPCQRVRNLNEGVR